VTRPPRSGIHVVNLHNVSYIVYL